MSIFATGAIPHELGFMEALIRLELHGNELEGEKGVVTRILMATI